MNTLARLRSKKSKLVVGLMSGTSADAVDAVLAEIRGRGTSTSLREIAFVSLSFPKGYKEFLLQNSLPGKGSVDTVSTLNILSAHFFGDAVKAVAKKARIPLHNIDLIGSHGQTIHHLPQEKNLFGKKIRSTLQIGDPSTIAALTGIPTVGNFRTADMAHGGQGAPLVPYFDYLMFRSTTKNRALLNIGGIANITLLKKNCTVKDVVAFDTGPGNMIVDALMNRFYKKEFDANGSIAEKGMIKPELLSVLMKLDYFAMRPPKSTGRERFGKDIVDMILSLSSGANRADIIATATEFTAITIYDQFNRFLRKKLNGKPLHELVVSGGGAFNKTMMNTLKKYFYPTLVTISDDYGVSSRSKEALCFAVLANETIHEMPSNIPAVTGAKKSALLGVVSLP